MRMHKLLQSKKTMYTARMVGHLVVGLGNPGSEYEKTRHNTGRMAVEFIRSAFDGALWAEEKKKPKFQSAKASIGGKKTLLLAPDTFMNDSGKAVAHFVKNKKDAGNTIVIYDDLDLPFGTFKISHGRGSGGHNGVESVIRALKTRDFVRVRVGVSPAGTKKGTIKKPQGEERVLKFLLGAFTPSELTALKKNFKTIASAVETIITQGKDVAMTTYN